MKKLLDHIPHWLKNRYGLGVLVLLGWIAFFDNYDLYTTWKLRRHLSRMEDQQEWYLQEITATREQLHQLTSDKELLEKFAGVAGPAFFWLAAVLTGSSRAGLISVVLFFAVGGLLLARVDVAAGQRAAREAEAA